ncbi:MAG TPA: AI-2E family transporter [Gaiellaceae bacterium]|nr:AI-2E family transporter [Gaiellaceae bacterium]
MAVTARRAAVATLVALAIVVAALALWKIRIVIALLLLGFVVAAAMRPSVEWLHRRWRVPRSLGVLVHYLGLAAAVALFLWLVVPPALNQLEQAIGSVPTSTKELHAATAHSHGIRHQILAAVQERLERLPSGTSLLHPAVTVTKTAFEALVGVFFMFAVGAYWISERDRTIALVQSLVPRRHRRVTRDTWVLIDRKLGAFVRGELILIVFVAVVLSFAFWLDGLPYWILLGSFAGVVEIVPIVGPIAAGALAIGVGLTVSWQTALGAGLAVLVLRQLEDYVVVPRVLGHAVGLSPLLVLVSVTAVGVLLGAFYVLLAIPLASLVATLVDVIVRDRDPADEETPAVLFTGANEANG